MPPELCGAKPDAIQGSRCGRFIPDSANLLKATALEFIIPHSSSKSTPPPQISPSPHLYSPTPSAHCPQKRSHTLQLQQNSPSNPSPTTALQHSPSFFDPFPDETTRFRPLPLQKVHPAFHPPPLQFQNNRIVKPSFPSNPPIPHPCNPLPSPNNTVFPVPLAALQK